MTPKSYSSQKTNMGIKKRRILCRFKSVEMGEINCFFGKLWAKTHAKFGRIQDLVLFVCFLPVTLKKYFFKPISAHLKAA